MSDTDIVGGNGHSELTKEQIDALGAFVHSPESTDKAFKNQDMLNAIRMIILADPDIMENVFRYNIPDRRFACAAASYHRKCKEHNYNDGINQLMMQLGLMGSIGEARIKHLVQAVIGDREWKDNQNKGFADKFKNWALNKQA